MSEDTHKTGHSEEMMRGALKRYHDVAVHKKSVSLMSIPADPWQDADLILGGTIDEVLALRKRGSPARELLRETHRVLNEAREMLGVLEDHGGHDGLGGKGYVAVLDHIDDLKAKIVKADPPPWTRGDDHAAGGTST